VLEKPHKKLDVWKKSMELVGQIYELTKSYPQSENYVLINQMRRAAISVSANISEGAARNTKKRVYPVSPYGPRFLERIRYPLRNIFSIGLCERKES